MMANIGLLNGWSSDHLPISVKIENIHLTKTKPQSNEMWQWKWKCAKWHAYSEVLTTAATKLKNIETVQKLATRISVEILKAAKQTIPGYKKRTQTTFSVRDPEIERLPDEPNQDKVDKDAIAEGIRKIKRNIIECDMTGMDYQWAFRKVKQLEGGIVDNNISELEHEGSTTTDPKEMADIFTTAYATQFNLVDDEVPSLVFENKPGDEGNEEFTMRELKRQLKKLKDKKAPGPDGVWNTMLKKLPETFMVQLLRLFNMTWEKSAVPRSWKYGIVVPILKSGKDKKRVLSYRPITLTSAISKLFEKMMAERMHHLLGDRMSARQAAYKRGRSAVENLCMITERLLDGRYRGRESMLMTFDLQKAFDAVQPKILLKRMSEVGIPAKYTRWVQSYLTGRKITTRVNGEKGTFKHIQVGVPQGSVLGPQLFPIYIESLIRELNRYKPAVFADDVGLVMTSPDVKGLEDKANTAVRIFSNWAAASHICINKSPGKTEFIHVRPDTDSQDNKSPQVLYPEGHTFKYVVTTAEAIRKMLNNQDSTTIGNSKKAITHFYVVPQHKIKRKLPTTETVLVDMQMEPSKCSQLQKVRTRGDILRMLQGTGSGLKAFAFSVVDKLHETDVVRYLGVLYDKNLDFKTHMRKMMTAASRGLGLLLRLSKMGCRKRTLICVLVTVVMARVLYGVESFAWLLPKRGDVSLERLNILINRAARQVTGCLPSTRLRNLYHEADMPKLQEHIRYKMCRAYEEFKLSPHLPACSLTMTEGGLNYPPKTAWGRIVWDEYVSGIPGLDKHRSSYHSEINPKHYKMRSWKVTNAIEFNYCFGKEEAKDKEAGLPIEDVKVYTDGSIRHRTKTYMTKSGASVIIVKGKEVSMTGFRIPVAGSSYRTEQIAVEQAMRILLKNKKASEGILPTTKTHILTDSMSLIQALERGPEEQKSATNASIWKLALKLEHRGVNINMQYVPAHMDVLYNEIADKVAKHAAGTIKKPPDDSVVLESLVTRLDMGTLMTFHKRRKREEWIGAGEQRHPPFVEELTRPQEVLMSRFRVGHCRSLKLKGINEQRIFCHGDTATPHHVLFKCNHWCIQKMRSLYIHSMINTETGEVVSKVEDCFLKENQRSMSNFVVVLDQIAEMLGRPGNP